jgi:hypothetical protein
VSKFRTKPVVIEAMQFDGSRESAQQVVDWAGVPDTMAVCLVGDNLEIDIVTLEGVMHARAGDWVIRGIKGELYPCNPDIFAATYEPAGAVLTPDPSLRSLAALQGYPPASPAQPPFIIHAPELDGSAECFHGQDSGPNCANDAHYRLPTYNDWMGHSPAAKQWIARQAPPPASPDGPACAFCHRQPPPPHIVADDLSVAICFECIEKFSFKRTRQAPPPAVSGAEPEK